MEHLAFKAVVIEIYKDAIPLVGTVVLTPVCVRQWQVCDTGRVEPVFQSVSHR